MIRSLLLTTSLATGLFLQAQTFTLSSSSVGGQATMNEVFDGFGCTGANISPQLSWTNPPEGTKGYAITIYDKDAPTGSGWWHWLVFDLPATTLSLPAGAGDPAKNMMPAGAIQSRTDFGAPGYGGPCPPPGHGPHQYVVTVYALKTDKLGLDANASPAVVGYTLNGNTLAKASIVFYYERK
jgi:Raf kinase inhibitor-like YbhB/YbcL family protein